MRKYELMTITRLSAGEDGARDISNSIKDLISNSKGKVMNSDFWGKRRFSYPIENLEEGYYEVIEFELLPSALLELNKKLNLTENLVRYLLSQKEE